MRHCESGDTATGEQRTENKKKNLEAKGCIDNTRVIEAVTRRL